VWKIRWTDGGQQEACALILDEVNGVRWLVRCTSADTAFIDLWPVFEHMISGIKIEGVGQTVVEVPPPVQGYAYYRVLDDYQLMVPDNWTVRREGAAGMDNVSMWAIGPQIDGFSVNILLQSGLDPSLSTDHAKMLELVEDRFLPEIQSQGIDAAVEGEPDIVTISGLSALTFTLKLNGLLDSSLVFQDTYLIVDGDGRYWLLTCSAPERAYPNYGLVFDTVAHSFTVLSITSPSSVNKEPIDSGALLMVGVMGAVAIAAVGALFALARMKRRGAI
jgi:hypothetical protein